MKKIASGRVARRRFTLIEMLAVLVIVMILAGLTAGIIGYANRKSAETTTTATLRMLEAGLAQYQEKFGYYPAFDYDVNGVDLVLDGVDYGAGETSVDNPENNFCSFVEYKFLKKNGVNVGSGSIERIKVRDGWGKPIRIRLPGTVNTGSFDLWSGGPDLTDNAGSGDDLTNFVKVR